MNSTFFIIRTVLYTRNVKHVNTYKNNCLYNNQQETMVHETILNQNENYTFTIQISNTILNQYILLCFYEIGHITKSIF